MRFRGVTFDSTRGHKAIYIEEVFDLLWTEADILGFLSRFDAPAKELQQLWTAAEYREGFRRCTAGIEVVYCAVLDRDSADVGALDETCAHLDSLGLAYVVYSTWSHLSPEKVYKGLIKGPFDCFRVVLPYSRPVSVSEHSVLVQGLMGYELPADPTKYRREVAGRFSVSSSGAEKAIPPRGWDPVSARPAQGYFLPSSRSSIDVREGLPVDVEAVLARPTTARPTACRVRTYSAPCRIGLGASGAVEAALAKRGVALGPEGYGGWRRAPCPACAPSGLQKSPSFTMRANGDGVDLICYDRCYRGEILRALGLTPADFVPPSELRLALEEQLERQAPGAPEKTVAEAVACLEADLREAVSSRAPTVIKYPPGVGKSFASAKIMSELVRAGRRVAYVTQEHAVAAETRSLLPPDVLARSVHLHSPLVEVVGAAVCRRKEELSSQVFTYGVSLLGKVCPKCPYREECEAHAEARSRFQKEEEASVVFVSHAGVRQVFNDEKGADTFLIVDEMPSVYEEVSAQREAVARLARGDAMPSADPVTARLAQSIALAWLVGAEPGEVYWGSECLGEAIELLREFPRLRVREGAEPRAGEKPLLAAADALIRLAGYKAEGGNVEGFSALLPSSAHVELVRRRGVLLSATPMLPALPDFTLREARVADGAKVNRKMVLTGSRGSTALTSSFYSPVEKRYVRRERQESEPLGIDWGAVDGALGRALAEAERYPDRRVLFVTFKPVADALRASPERLAGGRVSVGHFGALRGKNDWMEGRPLESSVVYLFGSPRQNMLPTIHQLGLEREAADQAWVDHAAGELAQAEGRLRLPRRTKESTVFCEGDVAPLGWHSGNIDELIELSRG